MEIPKSDAVTFAERVRLNQQKLAADSNTHVLLLEAGGTDEIDLVMNPNSWPMTLGTELDWGFVAQPNPNLNGRAIPYSMGKGPRR